MIKNKNLIATQLHCSSASIPAEYMDRAKHLASSYVKDFSLSGLYAMDYTIVYNRVCNLICSHLIQNPNFNLNTFYQFINADTLFYSVSDIQNLVRSYKANPDIVFPYVICFFARKLISFKRSRISYIKGLDKEDVDEVMMIAVYKTLERYNPTHLFSFSYLELELFAAITQLGGEMHTFGMSRNDYVNYLKFSYFIEKYMLTAQNIRQFLYEMKPLNNDHQKEKPFFQIDDHDRKYSCNISLRKALDYFNLYSIENQGILNALSYDEENDMIIDNSGTIIDNGFIYAELELYAEQTFTNQNDQRIFIHLTQPGGATFTNKELAEDYNSTRHRVKKIKATTKIDLF